MLNSFPTWLSGDNIQKFYQEYLEITEHGEKSLRIQSNQKKAERLTEKIRSLHTTRLTNLKSRYTSLISVAYERVN